MAQPDFNALDWNSSDFSVHVGNSNPCGHLMNPRLANVR